MRDTCNARQGLAWCHCSNWQHEQSGTFRPISEAEVPCTYRLLVNVNCGNSIIRRKPHICMRRVWYYNQLQYFYGRYVNNGTYFKMSWLNNSDARSKRVYWRHEGVIVCQEDWPHTPKLVILVMAQCEGMLHIWYTLSTLDGRRQCNWHRMVDQRVSCKSIEITPKGQRTASTRTGATPTPFWWKQPRCLICHNMCVTCNPRQRLAWCHCSKWLQEQLGTFRPICTAVSTFWKRGARYCES